MRGTVSSHSLLRVFALANMQVVLPILVFEVLLSLFFLNVVNFRLDLRRSALFGILTDFLIICGASRSLTTHLACSRSVDAFLEQVSSRFRLTFEVFSSLEEIKDLTVLLTEKVATDLLLTLASLYRPFCNCCSAGVLGIVPTPLDVHRRVVDHKTRLARARLISGLIRGRNDFSRRMAS